MVPPVEVLCKRFVLASAEAKGLLCSRLRLAENVSKMMSFAGGKLVRVLTADTSTELCSESTAVLARLLVEEMQLSGTTNGSDFLGLVVSLALLLCFVCLVLRVKTRPPEVCGVDLATPMEGKLLAPLGSVS